MDEYVDGRIDGLENSGTKTRASAREKRPVFYGRGF